MRPRPGTWVLLIVVLAELLGILLAILHFPFAGLFFILRIILWPIGVLLILWSLLQDPQVAAWRLLPARHDGIRNRDLVRITLVCTGLIGFLNILSLFKVPNAPLPGPFILIELPLLVTLLIRGRSLGWRSMFLR